MKITVQHLSLSLQDKKILDNIMLQAQRGKCVGIVGPNGSGKSSLLKCIYRILEPQKGTILLNDKNVKQLTHKQTAQQLAVMAQHHHNDFDFLVKDMVAMGRVPHHTMLQKESDKDAEIIKQALQKVDMLSYKNRLFSSLSGGEQQRVILARALCQEPKCLILDEPTNHLDIKYQFQLMRIVKYLGITVISAIHDLNIALHFCDDLYVLKEGKIVAYGLPEAVLTPQLIQEVYQVNSQIVSDTSNKKHIVFLHH